MNFIKMNQTNGYIYVRESKKLGYLNKMVILIKIFIKKMIYINYAKL